MAATLTLPDERTLSYALDAAPANAPIVLLANSLGAPFTAWDHVVGALNENGFRTLRYDQPGHGDSSAPKQLDTTFDSLADDVYVLLKTLAIIKLHAWIGVSMGAAGGIYFATKYPGMVGKLTICDTIWSSPVNAGTEDVFGERVAAVRKTGNMEGAVESSLERWFGTSWLEKNPVEASRMRSLMMRTSVSGFVACCNALRSSTFDLRPLVGKVGASVDGALLLVGEKDANLPQTMKEMRGKIEEGFKAVGKDALVELVVIENAGHVCFIDGFDQFRHAILAWLRD